MLKIRGNLGIKARNSNKSIYNIGQDISIRWRISISATQTGYIIGCNHVNNESYICHAKWNSFQKKQQNLEKSNLFLSHNSMTIYAGKYFEVAAITSEHKNLNGLSPLSPIPSVIFHNDLNGIYFLYGI